MIESMSLKDARARIDELAKNLASGNVESKGNAIIDLRKLCGRYLTVPTTYKLKGVVKEGDIAQRNSNVTELWKGRYSGVEVALKLLRIPRDDPEIQRAKSRFCKEVVLMKQADHKNILPFYGVSTDVSDFCLVFPWYRNGDIMDYLSKNPNVNQYDLLSGAANGLCFLHCNRLVHGNLRPRRILIDDSGNARLATAGYSSVVAVPGTSIAGHQQSALDGQIDDHRHSAPEILSPEDYGGDKIRITKESDTYGMAMVIYEVLTRERPYWNCNDSNVISKVLAGENPIRPSDPMIEDLVWRLLERCWNRLPANRPLAAEVFNALSSLSSSPEVMDIPRDTYTPQDAHSPRNVHSPQRRLTGELPGKLKLQFLSIKLSPARPKQHQFYFQLKYGNVAHKTSSTSLVDSSGEHKWGKPETWVIETNNQYHGQQVSLEMLSPSRFKTDKTCATGTFSLLDGFGRESSVDLRASDSSVSAVLKTRLIQM